jgi:putative transposase
LDQRKRWWERGQGVGASSYQQQAELPGLKAACPEFGAIHAHVLQEVILRLDRAFQAFFRRLKAGETPGYPRFQGRGRYASFTFPEYGNGVVLDGRVLSVSKIGRVRIRLHRSLEGTPKTVTISREADGWYACISCAEVPTHPLPPTAHETGIDLGIESFATLSNGTRLFHPGWYRKAGCGAVVYKGLSVRWHSCPVCGTSLHRDHNAAKKRERRGRSLQGGVAVAASEN